MAKGYLARLHRTGNAAIDQAAEDLLRSLQDLHESDSEDGGTLSSSPDFRASRTNLRNFSTSRTRWQDSPGTPAERFAASFGASRRNFFQTPSQASSQTTSASPLRPGPATPGHASSMLTPARASPTLLGQLEGHGSSTIRGSASVPAMPNLAGGAVKCMRSPSAVQHSTGGAQQPGTYRSPGPMSLSSSRSFHSPAQGSSLRMAAVGVLGSTTGFQQRDHDRQHAQQQKQQHVHQQQQQPLQHMHQPQQSHLQQLLQHVRQHPQQPSQASPASHARLASQASQAGHSRQVSKASQASQASQPSQPSSAMPVGSQQGLTQRASPPRQHAPATQVQQQQRHEQQQLQKQQQQQPALLQQQPRQQQQQPQQPSQQPQPLRQPQPQPQLLQQPQPSAAAGSGPYAFASGAATAAAPAAAATAAGAAAASTAAAAGTAAGSLATAAPTAAAAAAAAAAEAAAAASAAAATAGTASASAKAVTSVADLPKPFEGTRSQALQTSQSHFRETKSQALQTTQSHWRETHSQALQTTQSHWRETHSQALQTTQSHWRETHSQALQTTQTQFLKTQSQALQTTQSHWLEKQSQALQTSQSQWSAPHSDQELKRMRDELDGLKSAHDGTLEELARAKKQLEQAQAELETRAQEQAPQQPPAVITDWLEEPAPSDVKWSESPSKVTRKPPDEDVWLVVTLTC